MREVFMKGKTRRNFWITSLGTFVLVISGCFNGLAFAQNPELQQKVADLKQAAAQNKQELAQYTWVEQTTISLKGEQKKQEQYQVRLGPDGKPQKTPIGAPDSADSGGGRHGRLKEHVVEKKKEEYKEYADQIKELIQQYVPPDKNLIQQASQQGNILTGPEGTPGQYQLVIKNYVKPGDKMTLVIDKAQKALSSLSIDSYLNDPKDAVNVSVQFAAIPGGPNHVATETINGVSKQLTINVQNSNYQKL
jgi:hypothetical protein